MGLEQLKSALTPILDILKDADPADPGLAARLDQVLPVDGPDCESVREIAESGVEEGWLCDREAGGIRFSRPMKPSPESHDLSVDAVVMEDVVGPRHTHTNGEIDLCFAQSGKPRFDGNPQGWTVFPPGSTHRPTVTGGRMLILYFLPGGAIHFHRD